MVLPDGRHRRSRDRERNCEVAPKATRPIGEEIHASGLIVLPGLIDGHVHLGELKPSLSHGYERPLRVA